MFKFKDFNSADWFSFYRIFSAPFLVLFIWLDEQLIFTWLLFISYLTDAIDGYIARKYNITSSRGSQLDSLGDQVTLVIGLVGLFYFVTDFILKNIVLIMVVLVPYILQMLIALLKYGKVTAFHTYLAKTSAILQGVFVLWTLFFSPEYSLFYVLVIVGLIETIEEITLIFMYDYWVSDVKGIYWAFKDKRRMKKIE